VFATGAAQSFVNEDWEPEKSSGIEHRRGQVKIGWEGDIREELLPVA